MPSRTPPDPGDRRNPWTRPGFIAAAALLATLAIIAVILAATSGGGTAHQSNIQASQPTTTTPSSATTRSNSGNSTACTLPAGNQTIPSDSPPPGTSSAQVGSMSTPEEPATLGPQRTSGVFKTCFAHSPAGALLAAFNLLAEDTAGNPSDVYHRLSIGAPRNLGNNDRLDSNGPVQFAAYKYQSYTSSTAEILIVIKGYQGALEAVDTPMRWTGSDWRYLYPVNGVPPLSKLSDLTGYVPWPAF